MTLPEGMTEKQRIVQMKESRAEKKRIGIMGGTFNPIHIGHLLLAETAYREYCLDEVWFIPASDPPHKAGQKIAPYADRAEMTGLAIKDIDYFRRSDIETERKGYSYTSETLACLHEKYPDYAFYFIMGADSLLQIEQWHEPGKVLEQATVLASGRGHQPMDKLKEQIAYLRSKYDGDVDLIHIPEVDISSALIREKIANGHSVRFMVPDEVYHYIEEHKLYADEDEKERD